MSLYAIADLHLSFDSNKPMDIFGDKWNNHEEKIYNAFSKLTENDVTVICGDLSWGMNLEECLSDFKFIDSLPGKKIISKGNHDFYWTTANKMNQFFKENHIESISILHNNSFSYGKTSLCGTRGWFYEEEKGIEHDRKLLSREVGRLKLSLESAVNEEKIAFLHYPPLIGFYRCDEILSVLKEYHVSKCIYGHLHGKSLKQAFNGWSNSIEFRCVSADFVDFKPLLLIKD